MGMDTREELKEATALLESAKVRLFVLPFIFVHPVSKCRA